MPGEEAAVEDLSEDVGAGGQAELPVGDEVVIDDDTMRRALEAILMVTDEPLPVLTLARAVGRPPAMSPPRWRPCRTNTPNRAAGSTCERLRAAGGTTPARKRLHMSSGSCWTVSRRG